jgi:hypothetical protein
MAVVVAISPSPTTIFLTLSAASLMVALTVE